MEHLVYCDVKSGVLAKLLDGSKTKIIRGAAGRKLPHSRVNVGEKLYLVENDGSLQVKATAIVKNFFNSEKLMPEETEKILEDNEKELNLSKEQYKRWSSKKYLCIVEVENVQLLETPLIYRRDKNMDDWLIVEHIEDILEGSDKEYKNLRL